MSALLHPQHVQFGWRAALMLRSGDVNGRNDVVLGLTACSVQKLCRQKAYYVRCLFTIHVLQRHGALRGCCAAPGAGMRGARSELHAGPAEAASGMALAPPTARWLSRETALHQSSAAACAAPASMSQRRTVLLY